MKLNFKPMPWLTVIVAICLAILISLGTWQYQRLQWKTALLAEVDAAAEAAPFTSFKEVQAALDAGAPVDFRRIDAEAFRLVGDVSPYFVFTAANRDISWRLFHPVATDIGKVYIAIETLSDSERQTYALGGEWNNSAIGYVRLARGIHRGAAKSSPEKGRWFGFNPLPDTHNWADDWEPKAEVRFYIDTVPGAIDADLLPPKRPDIRNNHLDYMLTWYSFAVILLIIYFILHRRAGRLKFS